MALLPRALRPSVVIRRKVMSSGFFGRSKVWKIIGAFVFGQGSIKRFFGKNPETITKQKIGFNSFVNVLNAKPMSAKQSKALGLTKAGLKAQASADVADSWARKAVAKPKRKIVKRAQKTAAMAAADRRKADYAQLTRAQKKAAKQAS
ncbi:MAG: hypothetical protein ACI91Q_000112 [Gammaproteobacteria bacterium]|jgi:hypothetical protein